MTNEQQHRCAKSSQGTIQTSSPSDNIGRFRRCPKITEHFETRYESMKDSFQRYIVISTPHWIFMRFPAAAPFLAPPSLSRRPGTTP
jgi:hypothetical protein